MELHDVPEHPVPARCRRARLADAAPRRSRPDLRDDRRSRHDAAPVPARRTAGVLLRRALQGEVRGGLSGLGPSSSPWGPASALASPAAAPPTRWMLPPGFG